MSPYPTPETPHFFKNLNLNNIWTFSLKLQLFQENSFRRDFWRMISFIYLTPLWHNHTPRDPIWSNLNLHYLRILSYNFYATFLANRFLRGRFWVFSIYSLESIQLEEDAFTSFSFSFSGRSVSDMKISLYILMKKLAPTPIPLGSWNESIPYLRMLPHKF